MSMDINKVGALLHIADMASKHGTALQGIFAEAMGQLGEINTDLLNEQKVRDIQAAQKKAEEARKYQDAVDMQQTGTQNGPQGIKSGAETFRSGPGQINRDDMSKGAQTESDRRI